MPNLDARQIEFLDWLVDPNSQGSQNNWAREHDLHPSTLVRWKSLPAFQEAWRERVKDRQTDPSRLNEVMEAMFDEAKKGDVQAAKLWKELTDQLEPPKPPSPPLSREVEQMTDEELIEELEQQLTELRAQQDAEEHS